VGVPVFGNRAAASGKGKHEGQLHQGPAVVAEVGGDEHFAAEAVGPVQGAALRQHGQAHAAGHFLQVVEQFVGQGNVAAVHRHLVVLSPIVLDGDECAQV